MLGNMTRSRRIAVRDLGLATNFYEQTLGLSRIPTAEPGVQMFKSGDSKILVYESDHAGTNKATAATWTIAGDIKKCSRRARGQRCAFEHYGLPGMTLDGNVHIRKTVKAVTARIAAHAHACVASICVEWTSCTS
jgi:hypothetical protein